MRTANPALNSKTFTGVQAISDDARAMTIQGTVNRTFLLLAILFIAAAWSWHFLFNFIRPESLSFFLIGTAVVGLIVAIVTVFKKTYAPVTAPIYALVEGLFLGTLSSFFERMFPGIVVQAIALTLGVAFCLLIAYKSGWIKATENFKLGVVSATGAVFMVYMVDIVLRLFGVNVPFIHESGIIGIIFSAVVVVIAALNLVLDFDFIEKGAEHGAPKYMEWYAAFGLLVTLIWLYLEILRLLSKLRSR